LMPIIPFLAIGLGPAYRRFPFTTLALAIPSMITMVLAAGTRPLIGDAHTDTWISMALHGHFEHTVLSLAGFHGLVAVLPILAIALTAVVVAMRVTADHV